MSQFDYGTIDPNTKSGTQLASDLNDFRDALYTLHSGSAAPSYATAGLLWADSTTSDYLVRINDGTDDIPLMQYVAASNIARMLFDADEDSYVVMGQIADDTLSVFLGATEGYRFTATGLRFGAGNAAVSLDLQDKTDAIQLPVGDTAARPSPAEGMIRRNSETALFEGYDGSAWQPFTAADFAAFAADIIPDTDGSRDLGENLTRWAFVYGDTIVAENIGDGILSVPSDVVTEGAPKAWAGVTSAQALSPASYNVASVTDTGVGLPDINLTNAFATLGAISVIGGAAEEGNVIVACSVITTSQLSATVRNSITGGQLDSPSTIVSYGDLA